MSVLTSNTVASIPGKLVSNGAACAQTAGVNQARYLSVIFTPSSDGIARTVSSVPMDSVPNAWVAERAENLQGLSPANFIQTNTTGSAEVTQANLETVFSTTYYPTLTALLNGGYVAAGSNGTAVIPTENIAGTAGLNDR